jgi:hypothetical protein
MHTAGRRWQSGWVRNHHLEGDDSRGGAGKTDADSAQSKPASGRKLCFMVLQACASHHGQSTNAAEGGLHAKACVGSSE